MCVSNFHCLVTSILTPKGVLLLKACDNFLVSQHKALFHHKIDPIFKLMCSALLIAT